MNIYYNLLKLGNVFLDYDLKELTTIKIGGKVQYLFYPSSIKNLISAVKYLKKIKFPYYIFGNGSNILCKDDYHEMVIIKLNDLKKTFIVENNELYLSSNYQLSEANKKCNQLGYENFLGLSLVPATIGGAIKMNASCFHNEVTKTLKYIVVLGIDGTIKKILKDDILFKYRYSNIEGIILYAKFELKPSLLNLKNLEEKYRRNKLETQVYNFPSFGSTFKNTIIPAYKLIQDIDLQGKIIGKAQISMVHANFIINLGNAKFNDVFLLISLIKRKVQKKHGIKLECEVVII